MVCVKIEMLIFLFCWKRKEKNNYYFWLSLNYHWLVDKFICFFFSEFEPESPSEQIAQGVSLFRQLLPTVQSMLPIGEDLGTVPMV